MKKTLMMTAVVLLLCGAAGLFAEEPPIESGGWYWEDGMELQGEWFYDVAPSFKEQDGWAVVLGRKNHYWLYDTYTYHDSDEWSRNAIVNIYIPNWIESMGYVIDFDNIEKHSPNNSLASSVKALMKQRNCDVSVALITDERVPYVVINNYDKSKDMYWTLVYYLVK